MLQLRGCCIGIIVHERREVVARVQARGRAEGGLRGKVGGLGEWRGGVEGRRWEFK